MRPCKLSQHLEAAMYTATHARVPAGLLAASRLLWSAAFGNQQMTLGSFQHVCRSNHTRGGDSTAAGPSLQSAHKQRQGQTQQQQQQQQQDQKQHQQQQGVAYLFHKQLEELQKETAAKVHPQRPLLAQKALNFDDTPAAAAAAAAASAAAGGMPQSLQQPQVFYSPHQPPPEAGELAAAAAAAAKAVQADAPTSSASAAAAAPPQQQQAVQPVQPVPFQIPQEFSSSSSYLELMDLVVTNSDRLSPWQIQPHPSLQQLEQYERLKLSGGSLKGCRIRDGAYEQRAGLLRKFTQSKALSQQARTAHIPKTLLPHVSAAFRKFIHRAATPGLTAAMMIAAATHPPAELQPPTAAECSTVPAAAAAAAAVPAGNADIAAGSADAAGGSKADLAIISYTPAVETLLLPYFLEFCQQQYKQEIESYAAAVATLDLRSPHTWYPYARAIKRKIIYHGGPTNSGKTYNALQSLAAAERGVYCAPLRLLAMEVYETLNHMGVFCDLVTGQEVLRIPGSGHVACTVEMASLNAHADVAVIDEIQLIGDDQRGFAWSRALLGLPANTIHVCGDTSAVQLVRQMAALCGDEFELHTYERMTPLQLDPQGLPNGWADVKPGDAVVAFSRKNIYKARKAIEAATGQRTCIVYGALPAETRRHQARLFNDPHSDVNILIASDAIGLGLNFNIRRVIFTTLNKHSRMGRGMVPVPVSLVKQIAGRAGRRNSIYPEGCVTTLHQKDLPTLHKALTVPMDKLFTPAAGLAPEWETVELLSAQFPDLSLEQLLRKLDSEARLAARYFLCNQEQLLETARVLGKVSGLSLPDQFTLVNAPIDPLDHKQRRAFLEFTNTYAAGHPVVFNEGLMPAGPPISEAQMGEAESLHKIMGLWLWLSYRFEEGTFPGRERVQAMARTLSHWLNIGLDNIQAAAAREAAAAVQAAAAGMAAGSSQADSSGDCAESSDADEVNEAVFLTPVVELSQEAAAAAGAAAAFENSSSSSAAFGSKEQQPSKQQLPSPVVYINWGSTVSTDLAHTGQCGSLGSSSSISSTGSSSDGEGSVLRRGSSAAPSVDGLLPAESLETSFAAGTSHSVEVLEQLIMPEFDQSMAPFLRWKSRPKFVPPPAPAVETKQLAV